MAASGGRDSTALLHATARAARDLGLQVVALHVHHGLMPQADAWLVALRERCARWRRSGLPVTLLHRRLAHGPARGESVEAWARRERYAALAAMAREADASIVLLAHHRQDQAETVLLQALRGAGPRGLAGMPSDSRRDGLRWVRPWLAHEPSAIDAYVRRHRLRYVDDESNRDPRFARSRLREEVWPALRDAFPEAASALAQVAAHAHAAQRCLQELGEMDAHTCVDAAGGLQVAAWCRLSEARRLNVLRHWLCRQLGRGAPQTLVQRLACELLACRNGARWPVAGGQLFLHRGMLAWRAGPPASARPAGRPTPASIDPTDRTGTAGSSASTGAKDSAAPARQLDLSHPGVHTIGGWRGRLVVRRVERDGVPAALLAPCELRARAGGERFQSSPGSMPRSLKKQFQAAGVAAHDREGPLLLSAGRLVYVPGLGIDARVRAAEGADLMSLLWLPDDA